MPGNVDAYLAQLLSWSSVDYLIACVFVVEAVGMVLVRYRSGGQLRWLSPLAPLILGGWAFLLGQSATGAYQRYMAGPCPGCRSWPYAVQQRWHWQIIETSDRVHLQSVVLLVACFVCLVVVLFVRRRPSSNSRAVSSSGFLAAV